MELNRHSSTRGSFTGGGRSRRGVPMLYDYYQRAFSLFHKDLDRAGYESEAPHPIRGEFWQQVGYGRYFPAVGRYHVLSYVAAVERRMASIIGRCSLAYWLHLYRRLFPHSIGENKDPVTAALVRASLEAAIQKYARFELCDRVGVTATITLDKVFNGLLMAPCFSPERAILEAAPQLVLTDFGVAELREFYDLERLAYELWRSSALLRILGKGAPLLVLGPPHYVGDDRSDDLSKLVESYDERARNSSGWALTASGVSADRRAMPPDGSGTIAVPAYNVDRIPLEEFKHIFSEVLNVDFRRSGSFNFIWGNIDLRGYREAHVPFAEAFERRHGVPLDAVLSVFGVLCLRVVAAWGGLEGLAIVRYWQRAYEGPHRREDLLKGVPGLLPAAAELLNLEETYVADLDVASVIDFLTLHESKRADIDLVYAGPHYLFLPCGRDRVFTDYAWIGRRLFDLFFGVSIPDQNFKGDALERVVRGGQSALPVSACKSCDGGQTQIDAAFEADGRLVIAECRAVSRSIGFERGDPQAIQYRNQVVEKALKDTDDKAKWLADHPDGTNYDVRKYRDILPVAVTPFVEFIPSLDSHYWLTEDLPRVLTPGELRAALEDGTLAGVRTNTVSLS